MEEKEELWCHYSDLPSPSAYQKFTDYDNAENFGKFRIRKIREEKKNLLILLFNILKDKFSKQKKLKYHKKHTKK